LRIRHEEQQEAFLAVADAAAAVEPNDRDNSTSSSTTKATSTAAHYLLNATFYVYESLFIKLHKNASFSNLGTMENIRCYKTKVTYQEYLEEYTDAFSISKCVLCDNGIYVKITIVQYNICM